MVDKEHPDEQYGYNAGPASPDEFDVVALAQEALAPIERRAREPLPAAGLHFTVLSSSKGLLTKQFRLGADGEVTKRTAAFLTEGTACVQAAGDLEDFAGQLAKLKTNQAVAYGVPPRSAARIATKEELPHRPGAVARDRENFSFRTGPGVLLLDHDAGHVPGSYNEDELRRVLVRAVPGLELAPMMAVASASSHIYRSDTGEQINGLRGLHAYIPVTRAADVPRLGALVYERLWSAGFGAFAVSASGALLDRNVVDSSVWQPERLDFAAGAHCVAPLEQRRPAARLWAGMEGFEAVPLDMLVHELSTAEREAAAAHRAAARAAADPERRAVRDAYIAAQADDLVQRRGMTLEQARRIIADSVDRQLLFAEFVLYPDKGEPVTVGEVLDDPTRWHGRRFADPVEIEYRGDRRVAWANLRSGGRPYLFSHAHGGRRFELVRQPTVLKIQPGELTRVTDECLQVVREHGELFDLGPQMLVRIASGRNYAVTPAYLADYLGRVVRFEKFDGRSKDWVPTDPPDKLAKAIVERTGERGLAELRGVITAPTLRADGSVLDVPGYDSASGLLYLRDELTPAAVPAHPDRPAMMAALRTLMAPFSGFPFDGPVARAVMLCALLTATVRRSLPTAPALGFDAPAAGTGKTLAARCVSALGGHDASSFTPPGSDDETRKVLTAALKDGAGSIIFDNVIGPLGGAPLNQFLTEPLFAGRILGYSENVALPNTALFLATGNNLRTYADMCRRVLMCRLDANIETPFMRQFDVDPLAFVRAHRQDLVIAALTLIRAFIAAGAPRQAAPLGSFEAWDSLVRQPVLWLARMQEEVELADPVLSIAANAEQDDQRSALGSVLAAWADAFGATGATAASALLFAQGATADDFDAGPADAAAARAALRAALDELEVERSGPLNARRLGKWLQQHKGQIVAARRFLQVVDRSGTSVWRATAA